MKTAFYKITDEKRQRIEQAAMEEFSCHSFNEASLNNIIKKAGISKGGMFKYIDDKTDIYLHVFEIAMEAFYENQNKYLDRNETCVVSKVFDMVYKSKDFYLDEPIYFQLITQGSIDFNSPCYDQLAAMKHDLLVDQRKILLENIDWDKYKTSKDGVLDYIDTLFQGINIKLLQLLTGDGYYDLDGYFDQLLNLKDLALSGLKK
ncbi:TetR/AcrR family transcriptional regulator [Acidaminobacter sp. JC074]|uniref:TetR/AcrR family transcriptional regulator n=1 Tax=Acidaminobacter sp. JC074 TaxID=2530199 RepID=UPI001F0E943B|nr:TetR/AcrR family transcriptional regulator [Acidaminobacter sp. JC074]